MIARHKSSETPRGIPRPIPTLAELLNPESVEFGVEFADEVGCFTVKDPVRAAEAAEGRTPLTDDAVKGEVVETDLLDKEVALDGRLYPARA